MAFVAYQEVVKERVQCLGPRTEDRWNAADASLLGAAGTLIFAWSADQWKQTSGHEVSAGDKETHVELIRAP